MAHKFFSLQQRGVKPGIFIGKKIASQQKYRGKDGPKSDGPTTSRKSQSQQS